MPKRIKILFTIPNFDTAGSGKVVYDLVKGIDKTVFEPEICCFHDKGTFFQTIKTLGVKIHLFQFATPYRPFISLPLRVLKIYSFFKRLDIDLIHSWHWSSDISEPLAAKLAGIPFVYTKKAMGWGNKSWVWRSKLSTCIIAINNDMVSEFFSKMLNKVKYIPLGVDINFFTPLEKTYRTPEGIQFNADNFIILTVANLAPVKGVELLLDAAMKLDDNRIKVLVVGNNKNEYGVSLLNKYGQNDNIYFFGKQQDVRPYHGIADLFVIPTKDKGRKEGLPIAPLEAMSSGRVVLGSEISGIKDILCDFSNCLFNANSTNDLMNKIEIFMNESKEYKNNLAKNMRLRVEKFYNLKNCVIEHEKLYKSIIK